MKLGEVRPVMVRTGDIDPLEGLFVATASIHELSRERRGDVGKRPDDDGGRYFYHAEDPDCICVTTPAPVSFFIHAKNPYAPQQ